MSAASPAVVVRPDGGRITVGDPVTLRIQLHLPAGGQLAGALPDFREPLAEGVRLLRVDTLSRALRRASGDDVSGTVVVAFFRPNVFRLPPIAITYRATPGATIDTALSVPLSLTVTAVVPEGSGTLRDIKNIESAPISLRSAETVAATGLAVVLALMVGYRLRRRRDIARQAAGRAAVAAAAAGPYDAAIAKLAVIAHDWATRPDIEAHYTDTADVLRRYLADAHGVPALERTTPELIGQLPAPLSVPPARDAAGGLLGDADLVKFARYAPATPAHAGVVAAAQSILSAWAASTASASAPASASASAPASASVATVAVGREPDGAGDRDGRA